jgi:hypothetical protein
MSIRFELVSFELGGILPYGWGSFLSKFGGRIMGHEFTMVGTFRVTSRFQFSGRSGDTLPPLRWAESEYWWEGRDDGSWEYKGETDKGDLYQSAPGSPTWGGFAQGKTEPWQQTWVSNPGEPVQRELRTKLLTPGQCTLVSVAEAELQPVKTSSKYMKLSAEKNTARGSRGLEIDNELWFMCADKLAGKGRKLPCAALDRPGMALSGGSGQSGGGFTSKTTSPTRRRVLTFDLGIQGNGARFTATQILETRNAQPSISKFITPGLPVDWIKNIPEDYLAYWRSRLNLDNIEDQTYTLEPQSTIDEWKAWSRQVDEMKRRTPTWVRARPTALTR